MLNEVNALSDFPHARGNCMTNAFKQGNFESRCANCFCYVCDVPASECNFWCNTAAGQPAHRGTKRTGEELGAPLDGIQDFCTRAPPPGGPPGGGGAEVRRRHPTSPAVPSDFLGFGAISGPDGSET